LTITRERPGVYTTYQVSDSSYGNRVKGVVGLVGVAVKGTAEQVYSVTSASQAVRFFGESRIARLAEILFLNGVYEIKAVPVFKENGNEPGSLLYSNAFKLLARIEEVKILLCDTLFSSVHNAMLSAITNADNRNQHKIAVIETGGDINGKISNAAAFNNERVMIVAPSGLDASGNTAEHGSVAAAVAGAILSENDPAVPLNGAELFGLGGVEMNYTEDEIDSLVRSGISPVECVGGRVSVIRGVTTCTTDENGESDFTWHELTTVRIVDNVIPEVRESLRDMFSRAKNTAQTRDAIRTQVIIILEKKVSEEIIESYGKVSVVQDEDDPTICNVAFEFAVAHGLNKIILTANITV